MSITPMGGQLWVKRSRVLWQSKNSASSRFKLLPWPNHLQISDQTFRYFKACITLVFDCKKIQKDFTVSEINPFALLTLSENQWLPYPRNIAVCEVYTYQQGYRPPIILNQCLHLCNSVLAVAAFANISGSRFPLMPTWLKSHTKLGLQILLPDAIVCKRLYESLNILFQ